MDADRRSHASVAGYLRSVDAALLRTGFDTEFLRVVCVVLAIGLGDPLASRGR